MIDVTYVYSSASVEALEKLINSILETFNMPYKSISEMFWYGVFCKESTYANFDAWDHAPINLYIPEILENVLSTEDEKLDYVQTIMNQVIKGEIEKPQWMVHVEMETSCGDYEFAPSTFLRVIPKSDEYKDLAEKLIDFLYSPNLVVTMAKN